MRVLTAMHCVTLRNKDFVQITLIKAPQARHVEVSVCVFRDIDGWSGSFLLQQCVRNSQESLKPSKQSISGPSQTS